VNAIKDDEDNPWRWIGTAVVGYPCEVVVHFGPLGFAIAEGSYVLLDDGYWYRIQPPLRVSTPTAWRYTMVPVAKAVEIAPHSLIDDAKRLLEEHTSVEERSLGGGRTVDAKVIVDPGRLATDLIQLLERHLGGEQD
jgi:hypothetical protein